MNVGLSNEIHEGKFMAYSMNRPVRNRHRLVIALLSVVVSASAQSNSACDLNGDGAVDSSDVNLAMSMALGTTACTANIEAPLSCTVVTVQRVINAWQGQTCVTYNSHNVTLNWVASTSSGVTGYNVYRGSTSGGPYTLIGSSSTAVTYTDFKVAAGASYFYVVTAIDSSGAESGYSNEAQGTVPSP